MREVCEEMNGNIEIDGDPIPQARPKVTLRGKYPHAYDPSGEDKRQFAAGVKARLPPSFAPIAAPLEVDLVFFCVRPKSHYNKAGNVKPIFRFLEKASRPDLDNLAKFVLDALNNVVWVDDSQIVRLSVTKVYSDCPRTRVVWHVAQSISKDDGNYGN